MRAVGRRGTGLLVRMVSPHSRWHWQVDRERTLSFSWSNSAPLSPSPYSLARSNSGFESWRWSAGTASSIGREGLNEPMALPMPALAASFASFPASPVEYELRTSEWSSPYPHRKMRRSNHEPQTLVWLLTMMSSGYFDLAMALAAPRRTRPSREYST